MEFLSRETRTQMTNFDREGLLKTYPKKLLLISLAPLVKNNSNQLRWKRGTESLLVEALLFLTLRLLFMENTISSVG